MRLGENMEKVLFINGIDWKPGKTEDTGHYSTYLGETNNNYVLGICILHVLETFKDQLIQLTDFVAIVSSGEDIKDEVLKYVKDVIR